MPPDLIVVATPLDVIARLEVGRDQISRIVLADGFAANVELVAFLLELYPSIELVDRAGDSSGLPAFA